MSMSPRLRTWPKALHRLLINIDIDGRRPLSTPQRPLSLRGGNRSSCPLSDLRADRFERLSRVEIRHSFLRPEAAIRATAGEPSGYGPFPTHGQA
jgi:hypothetical protein